MNDTAQTTGPEVSVIISTRDRAEVLRSCLEALVSQRGVAPEAYEVIVVDNGSRDQTAQVVESIQHRSAQVRRLYEQRLGLSIARNAGVREAAGRIICFMDDDAIPGPDYVAQVLSSFEEPSVACMGGKIVASWPDGAPPAWFCPKYANVVAQTSFGEMARPMKKGEFPFGCNIAFRKRVFESLGGFDENLGKKGRNNVWGEEVDLCLRLRERGHQFFYNPLAAVSHVVGRDRATRHYFVESIFGKGVTEGHQKLAHRGRAIFAAYLVLKASRLAVTSLYYVAARPLLSDAARFRLRCGISWCAGYLYFLALRSDLGSISDSAD